MKVVLKRSVLSLSFVFVFVVGLRAQVHVIYARPDNTDTSIQIIHGNHFGFTDPAVPSKHRLVLMIEGTGSAAGDLFSFDTLIAGMGYAVISLDYSNNVITTVCSNSHDSSCFDNFRQEIVFGTPASPEVNVDSANSLTNRFRQFLRWLVKNDPGQGWEEYIPDDAIRWEKIIAAGHSQGAGHAAYLGKKFKLARVLIFSGPQDYLSYFHEPSGWLSDSSQTDVSRYFAFLHVRDPYDFHKQLSNCETLMQISGAVVQPDLHDTMMVSPGVAPKTDKHILVTDIQTQNPHGSVLGAEFKPVWEYMLEGKK
jgi:hypothetical protein